MLGLVISLVATVAPALPGASVTCAEGPSCGGLAPLAADVQLEEQAYATPAVIDCRSPVVPPVLSTLIGECIGMPRDASYRASRYPESEQSQSLAPAGHERRSGVTSCAGLPKQAPGLALRYVQPAALFATPAVVHVARALRALPDAFALPSRFGDPPDRPPQV